MMEENLLQIDEFYLDLQTDGRKINLLDTQALKKTPFPGLRPFKTSEAQLFFGREGQTEEIIKILKRNKFVAVLGNSGSGKSSLVRAGVLPDLYAGYLSGTGGNWNVAICRPGKDPIMNMAVALANSKVKTNDEKTLAKELKHITPMLHKNSYGILEFEKYLNENKKKEERENLLVIVDQFEELFRYKREIEEKNQASTKFVNQLISAAQNKKSSIYVVITMRSEFLGDCVQFRGLPEIINDGQYLVPRLKRNDIKMVITEPLNLAQQKINPSLVNRLVDEVGDDMDQLPLLQHVLMRTYNYCTAKKTGEEIDHVHYEAVGTITNALGYHATEKINQLSENEREIIKVVFQRLTDKASDDRGIRRPSSFGEILAVLKPLNVSKSQVKKVINFLRDDDTSFIMPPVNTRLQNALILDISHESLMRNWPLLKLWIEEEVDNARLYKRLNTRREYNETIQGALLKILANWAARFPINAAWASRYHKRENKTNQDHEKIYNANLLFLKECNRVEQKKQEEEEKKRVAKLRIVGTAAAGLFLLLVGAIWVGVEFRNQRNIVKNYKIKLEKVSLDTKLALEEKQKAQEEKIKAEAAQLKAIKAEQKALEATQKAERAKQNALSENLKTEKAKQFALREKEKALKDMELALLAREKAERAKEIAWAEKEKAEKAKEKSLIEQKAVELATENALTEQIIAERAKDIAITEKINAEKIKQEALLKKEMALEAERVAKEENEKAKAAKMVALAEKEKAEKARIDALTKKNLAEKAALTAQVEKEKADKAKEIALSIKKKAEKAKSEAEEIKKAALLAAEKAENAKKIALTEKEMAQKQTKSAEKAREIALAEKEKAEKQTAIEIKQQQSILAAKEKALAEKETAEIQKNKALKAQELAEKASQAAIIAKEKAEIAAVNAKAEMENAEKAAQQAVLAKKKAETAMQNTLVAKQNAEIAMKNAISEKKKVKAATEEVLLAKQKALDAINKTKAEKEKAEKEKNLAIAQRQNAEKARQKALIEKQAADREKNIALDNKQKALLAKQIADKERIKAEEVIKKAISEKQNAQKEKLLAEEAILTAEKRKQEAEIALIKAEKEKQIARKKMANATIEKSEAIDAVKRANLVMSNKESTYRSLMKEYLEKDWFKLFIAADQNFIIDTFAVLKENNMKIPSSFDRSFENLSAIFDQTLNLKPSDKILIATKSKSINNNYITHKYLTNLLEGKLSYQNTTTHNKPIQNIAALKNGETLFFSGDKILKGKKESGKLTTIYHLEQGDQLIGTASAHQLIFMHNPTSPDNNLKQIDFTGKIKSTHNFKPNLKKIEEKVGSLDQFQLTHHNTQISPDGSKIVFFHKNHFFVSNLKGEIEKDAPTGYSGLVSNLCFSNDGALIAATTENDKISIWNNSKATMEKVGNFYCPEKIQSVAFSPNTNLVLVSTGKNAIIYTKQGKQKHAFAHNGKVYKSIFMEDGEHLVTAEKDPIEKKNSFNIWSLTTGEKINTFTWHQYSPNNQNYNIELIKANQMVTSVDNEIYFWNAESNQITENQISTINLLGSEEAED